MLITMGDPAGIGPEIIAKAFRDAPDLLAGCVVAGDVATLRRAAHCVGGLLPVATLADLGDVANLPPHCVPVVRACRCWPVPLMTGAACPHAGRISALARACRRRQHCLGGPRRCGARRQLWSPRPYTKKRSARQALSYPGHTEYLQALAAEHAACALADVPVRMMLANPDEAAADFAADVAWAKEQGAHIERFSFAEQPDEFARNAVVEDFVERSGYDALPLALVDGQCALS